MLAVPLRAQRGGKHHQRRGDQRDVNEPPVASRVKVVTNTAVSIRRRIRGQPPARRKASSGSEAPKRPGQHEDTGRGSHDLELPGSVVRRALRRQRRL